MICHVDQQFLRSCNYPGFFFFLSCCGDMYRCFSTRRMYYTHNMYRTIWNKKSELQGNQLFKNISKLTTFKYTKYNCLPEKEVNSLSFSDSSNLFWWRYSLLLIQSCWKHLFQNNFLFVPLRWCNPKILWRSQIDRLVYFSQKNRRHHWLAVDTTKHRQLT